MKPSGRRGPRTFVGIVARRNKSTFHALAIMIVNEENLQTARHGKPHEVGSDTR